MLVTVAKRFAKFYLDLGMEVSLGPGHIGSLYLSPKPKSTRNPAIAEGPRDAGVPVEIW